MFDKNTFINFIEDKCSPVFHKVCNKMVFVNSGRGEKFVCMTLKFLWKNSATFRKSAFAPKQKKRSW